MTSWTEDTLDDGCYTIQSDIFQLGKVFKHLTTVNGLEIPSCGLALMEQMLAKSITAEAILKHPYLVESREADLSQEL